MQYRFCNGIIGFLRETDSAISLLMPRQVILVEANIATIKALEDTAFKKVLTPRRMSPDELFFDPEKMQ